MITLKNDTIKTSQKNSYLPVVVPMKKNSLNLKIPNLNKKSKSNETDKLEKHLKF